METVKRLTEVSNALGKSINDFGNLISEQAIRAYQLNCGLKETVGIYDRTIKKEEVAEQTDWVEELSIDRAFERMLMSKLRPNTTQSVEYKT